MLLTVVQTETKPDLVERFVMAQGLHYITLRKPSLDILFCQTTVIWQVLPWTLEGPEKSIVWKLRLPASTRGNAFTEGSGPRHPSFCIARIFRELHANKKVYQKKKGINCYLVNAPWLFFWGVLHRKVEWIQKRPDLHFSLHGCIAKLNIAAIKRYPWSNVISLGRFARLETLVPTLSL